MRPLWPADVEACAAIVGGDPLWRRYGVTAAAARRALRGVLAAGRARAAETGEVAVARRRGTVLGFVWYRRSGTFHHSGYIRWIAVAEAARGLGVGRRLMAHAEARILARGPNVFLMVSDFNVGAQAFYRTLGYRQVGAVPDYVVRGVTELVFRKTLGPIGEAAGPRPRRGRSAQRRGGRSPARRTVAQ